MTDTYACGIQMHRPEGDLYKIAGLPDAMSPMSVRVLAESIDLSELDPDKRYAWKALSDIAYGNLYGKTRSTKALFDAGFFDDGLPHLPHLYKSAKSTFACTSIEKIRNNLAALTNNDVPAVLVTSGGMAPIHLGHTDMMERAKVLVEEMGFTVVGGYFAPGHDSYVGQKYGGTAAIPAEHRCAMVELAVQDSDWLELDPWAARYMPGEINFTDLTRRLYEYLNYHFPNIPSACRIFYVYGSDNAGFSEALPGRTVMVERTNISSKQAREGQYDHLHPAVRDYLLSWQTVDQDALPYLIRNEEDLAIKAWKHIMPGGMEELTRRRIQLQSAVRLGIAQLYKMAGYQHKVHLLTVADERQQAVEVIKGRPVISLDAFFEATYEIHSTRYFAMAGSQLVPEFRAERSGFVSLSEQVAQIPEGHYVMVEDDSVTGGTIRAAKALLPDNVVIDEVVVLSDFAHYSDTAYYDVVDLRDFIVGSYCGGLSMILPNGQKARAPYVAPFVSLRSRAKIPASAELELSRVIWQANVRFFTDSGIRLQDCDYGFKRLARNLDWSLAETVEDFCRWHADALMENA